MSRDPSEEPGEWDPALLVRQAVQDDDGAWSPQRLTALAERADRRAARRRRRRLVVAPAAGLAAAAALVTGALVVPPLVAADRAVGPATPGPLVPAVEAAPDVTVAAEDAGRLTTGEVRTVLPGALAQPAPFPGQPEDTDLRDACGTGELAVTRPVERQSGRWQSPGPVQASTDATGNRTTRLPTSLRAQVDTYADETGATAVVAALEDSTRTCTPARGAPQPSYPVVREVFMADAFFGARDQPVRGQYTVTAVQVRGVHTASVTAVVTGVRDQWSQEEVAAAVAHLAAAAASRADDPGWREGAPPGAVEAAGSPVAAADVDQLVPGAASTSGVGVGVPPPWDLYDACGTAPLTGVRGPGSVLRGLYTDPQVGYADLALGDGAPTALGTAAVVVTASDFGTPADAQAYAAAFRDSAGTCTPTPGTLPLAPVDLLPGGSADALFTTAYDEAAQRYWHTAVVVRGSVAGTVTARVPGVPDREVAAGAAQRVVDLATTAAERGAADAASRQDGGTGGAG